MRDFTLIIDQVMQVVLNWPEYAEIAGVSERTMETIHYILF